MKKSYTYTQRASRIAYLEEKEHELMQTGSNGRNDAALYILRKELDILRLRHKKYIA